MEAWEAEVMRQATEIRAEQRREGMKLVAN